MFEPRNITRDRYASVNKLRGIYKRQKREEVEEDVQVMLSLHEKHEFVVIYEKN